MGEAGWDSASKGDDNGDANGNVTLLMVMAMVDG